MTQHLSYAFENEVYTKLPEFLEIVIILTKKIKFIRTEIYGEEINFFCNWKQRRKNIFVEAKLCSDDKKDFSKNISGIRKKSKGC